MDPEDLILLGYYDLIRLIKIGELVLRSDVEHKLMRIQIEPRDQERCRRVLEKGQADL